MLIETMRRGVYNPITKEQFITEKCYKRISVKEYIALTYNHIKCYIAHKLLKGIE